MYEKQHLLFLEYLFCFSKDSDNLIERWKRHDMTNLLELHNKTPVWNEGKQANVFICSRRKTISLQRNAIICPEFSRTSYTSIGEEFSNRS